MVFYLNYKMLDQATPMLPPRPECTKNDDCAPEQSCVNQRCVSPCTLGDSCGRGSFCHTQNHQPVCRCPNGYTGDPRIACIPRNYNILLILFLNDNFSQYLYICFVL